MRLELGAGAALLIGNVVVLATHHDAVEIESEDGQYIPFQDALDNVAACALDDARAADLHGRFLMVDGCVAGGHDDLDGDGHLDCWTAQYNGGSGGGVGHLGVRRRCLGAPIESTWSVDRGDTLEELDVPRTAGQAFATGVAKFVLGRPKPVDTASPALAWQIDAFEPSTTLDRAWHGLTFRALHHYTPHWSSQKASEREVVELALDHDDTSAMFFAIDEREEPDQARRCKSWDIMYGHGSIAIVDRSTSQRSWAFFEGRASGSGYPTNVACAGRLVVFELVPGRVGIVDPARGRWAVSEPGGAHARIDDPDGDLWIDDEPVSYDGIEAVLD